MHEISNVAAIIDSTIPSVHHFLRSVLAFNTFARKNSSPAPWPRRDKGDRYILSRLITSSSLKRKKNNRSSNVRSITHSVENFMGMTSKRRALLTNTSAANRSTQRYIRGVLLQRASVHFYRGTRSSSTLAIERTRSESVYRSNHVVGTIFCTVLE